MSPVTDDQHARIAVSRSQLTSSLPRPRHHHMPCCSISLPPTLPPPLPPSVRSRSLSVYFAITSSLSIKWFNFRPNLFSSVSLHAAGLQFVQ